MWKTSQYKCEARGWYLSSAAGDDWYLFKHEPREGEVAHMPQRLYCFTKGGAWAQLWDLIQRGATACSS